MVPPLQNGRWLQRFKIIYMYYLYTFCTCVPCTSRPVPAWLCDAAIRSTSLTVFHNKFRVPIIINTCTAACSTQTALGQHFEHPNIGPQSHLCIIYVVVLACSLYYLIIWVILWWIVYWFHIKLLCNYFGDVCTVSVHRNSLPLPNKSHTCPLTCGHDHSISGVLRLGGVVNFFVNCKVGLLVFHVKTELLLRLLQVLDLKRNLLDAIYQCLCSGV